MDPGPIHKRRRPAVACTQCRRRKIRCDRGSPCRQCRESPLGLDCVYNNLSLASVHNKHLNSIQGEEFTNPGHGHPILRPQALPGNFQDLDLFSSDMINFQDDVNFDLVDQQVNLSGSMSKAASTLSNSPPSSCCNLTPPSWTTSSSSTRTSAIAGILSEQGGEQQSQSSSSLSLDSEFLYVAESSGNGRGFQWANDFAKCERLRFLLDIWHPRNNEDLLSQSEYKTVQYQMGKFSKLYRASMRKHASREKPSRNRLLSWSCTARALLPPRHRCDFLLRTYVNTVEGVLRILHIPSFLSDYECFWASSASQSMDEEDDPFACKLLLALAIGSALNRNVLTQSSSEWAENASFQDQASRNWISYGTQWLARSMVTGSRLSLDTAQIMCLLAIAQHSHHQTGSASLGWLPGNHELTRVGIQMGLHREPRIRFPAMSFKEAEIRRRLWATMLELSMQLCYDEGLPAPMSPESYDCEPPSSITDEDLSLGGTGEIGGSSSATSKGAEFTPSTVLVLLARTQRLRLRILQLVNAPGASKAYEDSHRLAAELNVACCANLDLLRSTTKPTDFQINALEIFTRPFVLALHGPFADQAATNPAYYFSRKIRMESSVRLLAYTMRLVPAPIDNQAPLGAVLGLGQSRTTGSISAGDFVIPSPSASSAGSSTDTVPLALSLSDTWTTLLIHSHGHFSLVQRQATTALCLDLISELEEDVFQMTETPNRRQLCNVLRSAVGMFERRVRSSHGTHSAQEYVLFACANAYIEAMLQRHGKDTFDRTIAEAAQRALDVCCEAMEHYQYVDKAGRRSSRGAEEDTRQFWLHIDSGDDPGGEQFSSSMRF